MEIRGTDELRSTEQGAEHPIEQMKGIRVTLEEGVRHIFEA